MARTTLADRRAKLLAEEAEFEKRFADERRRLAERKTRLEREERERFRQNEGQRATLIGTFVLRELRAGNSSIYDAIVAELEPRIRKNSQRALFDLSPLAAEVAEPEDDDEGHRKDDGGNDGISFTSSLPGRPDDDVRRSVLAATVSASDSAN